jgi:hypothetical protein
VSPKFVRGGERPKPQPGVIVDLRPYDLHGTRYYAVGYRLDGDPAAREVRLSFDMIYDGPQPGDRVLIQRILGVVDRMTREAAHQSPVTNDQDTGS